MDRYDRLPIRQALLAGMALGAWLHAAPVDAAQSGLVRTAAGAAVGGRCGSDDAASARR
jgi:hypothetical protein